MSRQLSLDHLQVGDGFTSRFPGAQVNHMHDGLTAFDMPQEIETQPFAKRGPLDQAWHVSDCVGDITCDHHSQVRHQRGERVVGDLWFRAGDGRDQRGLPGGGKPDQTDIGQYLQLQLNQPGLALLTKQRKTWGLAGSRRESLVPQPAFATDSSHVFLARPGEIRQVLPRRGIRDNGASWHGQHHVFPSGAVLMVTAPGLPVGRFPDRLAVVFNKRVEVVRHSQDHGTSIAPVATVRPAKWLEFLTVHRGAAMAAIACLHGQPDSVYEGGNRHDEKYLKGVRKPNSDGPAPRRRRARRRCLIWLRLPREPR